MKYRVLLASIVAACAVNVYADNNSNNGLPEKCPSPSSLQSVNLSNITKFENEGVVVGFQYNNKYDTNVAWDVAVIAAKGENNKNNDDAAKLGRVLSSLEVLIGPFGDGEGYVCLYASTSEENAGALAVKPGLLDANMNNVVNKYKFKG